MTLLLPNTAQEYILNLLLNQNLKLKLYSNNHTPAVGDTVGSLTEVTGGGYTEVTLTFANWSVVAGPPAVATYDDYQDFLFTGPTGGPGTIYGYYITDNGETQLIWEERFPTVPLEPINGSVIRIKPRITLDND